MADDNDFQQMVKERFAQLPKVVQDAITSADVSTHLRTLAQEHKLHVDQWEALEHEVQLTLMGFKEADNLTANLKNELGIPLEDAQGLATSISSEVFEPIRKELERQLEGAITSSAVPAETPVTPPAAAAQTPTPTPAPQAAPVKPVTPPPAAPAVKANRSNEPIYLSQVPSSERKSLEGDPYREQVG